MVGPIRSEQTYYTFSLAQQAHRQLATYWRVRLAKTLEEFELHARRMLTIEMALEEFAQQVCAALAPMMERLLAQGYTIEQAGNMTPLPLPAFAWAKLGVGASRRKELKTRYRQLAKEVHPDTSGEEGKVGLGDVNDAYAQQDLAKIMRLEAELLVPDLAGEASAIDDYLRQVEAATTTYRKAYTELLHAPLYALYSRANCAKTEGWDWLEHIIQRTERLLEQEKAAA